MVKILKIVPAPFKKVTAFLLNRGICLLLESHREGSTIDGATLSSFLKTEDQTRQNVLLPFFYYFSRQICIIRHSIFFHNKEPSIKSYIYYFLSSLYICIDISEIRKQNTEPS